MQGPLCDAHSYVRLISALSGGLSFAAWLVAQIPQLVETYQQKSVDGLSPLFIGIWIVGDIGSLIGCVLTKQLLFQFILAIYFLFNDLVLCGQYYYYGVYLKKHHHHLHHHHHHSYSHSHSDQGHYSSEEGRSRQGSLVGTLSRTALPAVAVASTIGSSTAAPISSNLELTVFNHTAFYGVFFAWFGALCYFLSRIPQLWKNYQRKSTEDLSPFLFACTLFGNLTYTLSILVSCEFVYDVAHRWQFFLNELPYIIGSAGTIIFDIFYFYQVWLYRDVSKASDELAPLLSSH